MFPDHKTHMQEISHRSNQFHPNGRMANGTNSIVFDELMKIVGRGTQTERISIFLAEISNFVSNVRMLKPKILHSDQTPHPSTSEYYLDTNVSKVLDLPEGLHQLNDRAFDDHSSNNTTFSTYIDDRPTEDPSSVNNLNLFPQVNYDQISDNAVEAEALRKTNGNDTMNDLVPQDSFALLSHSNIPLDLFSFADN